MVFNTWNELKLDNPEYKEILDSDITNRIMFYSVSFTVEYSS